MIFLANSNGSGIKAVIPAVAGAVTTTASKMQLCQEEEHVWHHAIRTRDGFGSLTPVKSEATVFGCRTVIIGDLMVIVWHESKEAVGIFVTVLELDYVAIGFEALLLIVLCG